MPYRTEYVAPDVVLNYKRVTVYNTYKDDNYDNEPFSCWFTTFKYGDEGEHDFDIRELPNWNEEVTTIKFLKEAIDAGHLLKVGVKDD